MLVFLAIFVLIGYTAWFLTRRFFRKLPHSSGESRLILVVLGSGGHTGEMFRLIEQLDLKIGYKLHFLVAEGDTSSLERLQRADSHQKLEISTITRPRKVGQPLISAILPTILAYLESCRLVLQLRPTMILMNGPGTCVPVGLAAVTVEFLTLIKIGIFFCESFCRTKSLSLTGRLLRPLADRFFVFWPALKTQCEEAILLSTDPVLS